ncbi:MAG: DNA primase [Crocinitomicaceae bacterium]|nr:DNA primase [Crocinitomicaceae bacterium]MDG1776575.1 DNA primase [Crocinitomicaceae bacterium]
MAIIPPHIVDDIMQNSRIEEVIGEFVQLKRAGSNLKGLSPFTDEKTASFVVSPAKQIFKCFSTGKGGTVVSFLMEKEHYTYPEALRWLAEKYGIQLPEDKPATAEELAAISERESLHIINEFAKDHFKNNLHDSEEGKKIALSYFIERGFRPDIIEKFQLGYSINKSDDFTSAALTKGYKIDYLEKVGISKTKDNRSFDFFRGRVMFPIHSVSGRVLGFGGRTLFTDKKIAKYFNSPESIIYNKSEILYGLHFSKGDIIKYDNCFLCEGYTDVISMYQAGIQNVVSSSGTSLTREQIRLVKRYTKNITILYDGDAAGIKASFRGIDLILEEGLNVKVVLFPEGEDPDSYSKAVSSSELETYIKTNQQDFISFKAEVLLETEGNDPIKKATLIKDLAHSVSLIPDQITRSVFIPELAKRFNLKEEVIWTEVTKARNEAVEKEKKDAKRRSNAPNSTAKASTARTNTSAPHPTADPYLNEPSPFEESPSIPVEILENHNEHDLMRILVLYGPMAISLEQVGEKGQKTLLEVSVAEYICSSLNEDDLGFESPTFTSMYQLINESLQENTFLKPDFFKSQLDQGIVQFVSEIEMNKHELSHNWITRHSIFTNSEQDKLKEAVLGSVYSFKSSKVEKRIKEIQQQLIKLGTEITNEELMDLLSEQVALEQIKKAISVQLGRIIIH